MVSELNRIVGHPAGAGELRGGVNPGHLVASAGRKEMFWVRVQETQECLSSSPGPHRGWGWEVRSHLCPHWAQPEPCQCGNTSVSFSGRQRAGESAPTSAWNSHGLPSSGKEALRESASLMMLVELGQIPKVRPAGPASSAGLAALFSESSDVPPPSALHPLLLKYRRALSGLLASHLCQEQRPGRGPVLADRRPPWAGRAPVRGGLGQRATPSQQDHSASLLLAQRRVSLRAATPCPLAGSPAPPATPESWGSPGILPAGSAPKPLALNPASCATSPWDQGVICTFFGRKRGSCGLFSQGISPNRKASRTRLNRNWGDSI